MNLSAPAASRWPSALLLFLAAFALWLLNHPYVGLWHDAQIYAVIAARWLRPQDYANELFFAFGSQGDLTIFTWMYAPLVDQVGLDHAAQAIVIAGGAGWVAAMMWLGHATRLPGWAIAFIALCAGLLTVNYSPNGSVFNFPESFATARTLAIPLGIAAIAATAAGCHRSGWTLALLALGMHPLMGIWPLALIVVLRAGLRIGTVLCVLVLAGFVLAGVLDLELPLARLMPEGWLHFARDHSPDAWFRIDGDTRVENYLTHLAVVIAAAIFAKPENRRTYVGMALLAASALAMAWLSAHVWPVEVVMQGQPWRVFWLTSVIAGVGLVDMLAYQSLCLQRFARPLGVIALFVVVASVPLWWADVEVASSRFVNPWWADESVLNGLVAGGMWQSGAILASLAALIWRMQGAMRVTAVAAGLVLTLGALAWTMPQWDRRVPHLAKRETCFLNDACPPHPFRAVLKPGEIVYWPGDETRVWLELRRPTYLSGNQRAGGVFSQRKSAETERRTRHVAQYARSVDAARLCSDPIMDWLIFGGANFAGAAVASAGGMHLHRCDALRAVQPSP